MDNFTLTLLKKVHKRQSRWRGMENRIWVEQRRDGNFSSFDPYERETMAEGRGYLRQRKCLQFTNISVGNGGPKMSGISKQYGGTVFIEMRCHVGTTYGATA
jgi:hypothetical protein